MRQPLHTLAADGRAGERGQTVVLTVVFLVVLMGCAGLVIDVGAWFKSDRDTQSAADASALAGAQALPDDGGTALALASQYLDKNGGGDHEATLSTDLVPGDTISVTVERSAQSFFTKLFGIDSVQVSSKASARAATMGEAKYVAPMVVHESHPKLACLCFGPSHPTTIPLDKMGAPGAFGIINLDNKKGGTGPPILADWILEGYQEYLPLGLYYSDPGAKFNSSHVKNAMEARIGTVLLFPVFDTLTGGGANAQYNIIGWAGFYLTDFDAHGTSATIDGYFESITWQGLASQNPSQPYFGAKTVSLVE